MGKNEDPYDGELDTIFLLHNDNIITDVQNATAKELYTAILTKTNTEVLYKAKWEHVFGDKIIWENIWKTIHSGLIDTWDLNIIYKLIHQVIAVRKKPISLEDRAHVRTWTQSYMPFSTARRPIISLNKLNRFLKNLLATTLN